MSNGRSFPYLFVVASGELDGVTIVHLGISRAFPVVIARAITEALCMVHAHKKCIADLLSRALGEMVTKLGSAILVLGEK